MNLRKNKNINVSSYAICVFNEIGVTTNIVHLQNTSNSWTLQDCLPKHQLELKDELRSLKKTFFKVRCNSCPLRLCFEK